MQIPRVPKMARFSTTSCVWMKLAKLPYVSIIPPMSELGPNQPPDEFEKTLKAFQDLDLDLYEVLSQAGFNADMSDVVGETDDLEAIKIEKVIKEFATLRLAYIDGTANPEQLFKYGRMMWALKVAVETARSKPK